MLTFVTRAGVAVCPPSSPLPEKTLPAWRLSGSILLSDGIGLLERAPQLTSDMPSEADLHAHGLVTVLVLQ